MERNDEKENEIDRMITERFSSFRPEEDWQPNLQRGLAILRQTRGESHQRRKRWTFVALGTAAACLPLMALPVTRAFAARCVSVCVQETAAVRELLLGHNSGLGQSSAFVKPADRRMAPDFSLRDASGQTVRLSDSRGKVVLVNFWATWCAPCEREIPWFVDFQRSHGQDDFTVLGISMDVDGWNAVKPYVERKKINFPVVLGNEQVARLFGGLEAIPLTLVIDRSGRVAAIHAGLCRRDEYEGDITAVLNER